MTTFKVKMVLCDQAGHPLYWQWLCDARPGDTVTCPIPDGGGYGGHGEWTAIPARPAGQYTEEEWAKVDPLLGQAYREFGLRASDLVMQAYRLGRDEEGS